MGGLSHMSWFRLPITMLIRCRQALWRRHWVKPSTVAVPGV
ncbi:MAG TPA: hypothetical protein VLH79_12750 [Chthonomonadales bacterium]|nr:hypothetical protein [Chthonomonadales bacterium]